MSNFRLIKSSNTVFQIRHGREQIGTVVQKHDGTGFYGRMRAGASKVESTRETASEVFHDLVTQANRISLCGKNDAELARKALEQRNANVLKRQAELAADPIMRDIAQVAESLGIRLTPPRVRSRRIAI